MWYGLATVVIFITVVLCKISMNGLTFDWDDVEITDPKVQAALAELDQDFKQRSLVSSIFLS